MLEVTDSNALLHTCPNDSGEMRWRRDPKNKPQGSQSPHALIISRLSVIMPKIPAWIAFSTKGGLFICVPYAITLRLWSFAAAIKPSTFLHKLLLSITMPSKLIFFANKMASDMELHSVSKLDKTSPTVMK